MLLNFWITDILPGKGDLNATDLNFFYALPARWLHIGKILIVLIGNDFWNLFTPKAVW